MMAFRKAFAGNPAEAMAIRLERIALDDLAKLDQISIRTIKSTYRFAVINPATQQGVLTGGSLDESPRRAVLLVSLMEDGKAVEELRELKIGARAIFYLLTQNGMERLITETITGLAMVRYTAREWAAA